jgi:hypothetical protein
MSIDFVENTTPNESAINEELMAAVRAAAGRDVPGSLVAPVMNSGGTDSAPLRRSGGHRLPMAADRSNHIRRLHIALRRSAIPPVVGRNLALWTTFGGGCGYVSRTFC